jgi:transposase-like protein
LRGGRVRSHHVPEVTAKTLGPILEAKLDGASFVYTDEGGAMKKAGSEFVRHDPEVTAKTLGPILEAKLDGASFVYTDEGGAMKKAGSEFVRHDSVNHSIAEYVRHTNTIEGYFSIMKRGINGVYHHVSQQHLKRYLAEFDFRYNERSAIGVEDAERMTKSVKGIVGKRLTN